MKKLDYDIEVPENDDFDIKDDTEPENWDLVNSMNGPIKFPKGLFQKIYDEAKEDDEWPDI